MEYASLHLGFPNMQVPVTTASDEYVAALKSEFQAALVRVLLSEPPAPLLTHGACMWEARTLDKTSEEKASDQSCLAAARVALVTALLPYSPTFEAELQQELASAAAASQEGPCIEH